jgi:hypothetical protein
MPVLAEGGEGGGDEGPFTTKANRCDLLAYSHSMKLIILLKFRGFTVLPSSFCHERPFDRSIAAERPSCLTHSTSLILAIRARIFKLLRSPRIDSKESIPPAYVARRAVRQTYLYSVPSPHRLFVNLLRSTGIDSQHGGPVRQPYLLYRPARLYIGWRNGRIPQNRFLGYLNVYKHGLCREVCRDPDTHENLTC